MTRDHVDDRGRHKERGDPPRAAINKFAMHVFNHGQAANTGADIAPDARCQLILQRFTRRQATVGNGLAGGSQPKMNEAVHMTRFFLRDVIRDIETRDLACELAGEITGIKLGDQVNAAVSGNQVRPGFADRISHGADATQACHNDTTTAH